MSSPNWIPWVARSRDGDMAAFERLYHATRPRLHHAVLHMVGSAEEAREIVQKAFVKAWERLPDLQEDAAFAGWLRRIAVNLVRDFWRARKPEDEIVEDDQDGALVDETPDPSEIVDGLIEAERLRAAVLELPQIFREAVVLHYLDGSPVDEVARALEVPRGTILSRLSRARTRLRTRLAQPGPTAPTGQTAFTREVTQ
jgi:RNA polymerase sigma-70 factor (ECF subfamily)